MRKHQNTNHSDDPHSATQGHHRSNRGSIRSSKRESTLMKTPEDKARALFLTRRLQTFSMVGPLHQEAFCVVTTLLSHSSEHNRLYCLVILQNQLPVEQPTKQIPWMILLLRTRRWSDPAQLLCGFHLQDSRSNKDSTTRRTDLTPIHATFVSLPLS